MPRFMFGTNDPDEAAAIMVLMKGNANPVASVPQGGMAPPPRPTALPPMGNVAPPQAAPPPPPPAAPVASSNPRLDNVIRLMDAYAKAGHKVDGVRKVLTMAGLSRAQDADEAQLVWLETAFANTAWAPPG